MAKKSNYEIVTTELSKDPFAFLDDLAVKEMRVTGFKARNPHRTAQMYEFLRNVLPGIIGHRIDDHIIKTLCVILDNETGYRSVREGGFPFTAAGRAYIIKYCSYLAGQLDNGPPQGKAATMETDYVKYRGTGWIQLTGRANFLTKGDTAYAMRKLYPNANPVIKPLLEKWPTLSGMPSVCIDLMAMDPLWNIFVMIIFLSKTGKNKTMVLSDRVDILNDTTVTKALALIGYDNDPKPPKWAHVPSLDNMINRTHNFLVTTSKTTKYEKDQINARSRTQDSRRPKFTRSPWA